MISLISSLPVHLKEFNKKQIKPGSYKILSTIGCLTCALYSEKLYKKHYGFFQKIIELMMASLEAQDVRFVTVAANFLQDWPKNQSKEIKVCCEKKCDIRLTEAENSLSIEKVDFYRLRCILKFWKSTKQSAGPGLHRRLLSLIQKLLSHEKKEVYEDGLRLLSDLPTPNISSKKAGSFFKLLNEHLTLSTKPYSEAHSEIIRIIDSVLLPKLTGEQLLLIKSVFEEMLSGSSAICRDQYGNLSNTGFDYLKSLAVSLCSKNLPYHSLILKEIEGANTQDIEVLLNRIKLLNNRPIILSLPIEKEKSTFHLIKSKLLDAKECLVKKKGLRIKEGYMMRELKRIGCANEKMSKFYVEQIQDFACSCLLMILGAHPDGMKEEIKWVDDNLDIFLETFSSNSAKIKSFLKSRPINMRFISINRAIKQLSKEKKDHPDDNNSIASLYASCHLRVKLPNMEWFKQNYVHTWIVKEANELLFNGYTESDSRKAIAVVFNCLNRLKKGGDFSIIVTWCLAKYCDQYNTNKASALINPAHRIFKDASFEPLTQRFFSIVTETIKSFPKNGSTLLQLLLDRIEQACKIYCSKGGKKNLENLDNLKTCREVFNTIYHFFQCLKKEDLLAWKKPEEIYKQLLSDIDTLNLTDNQEMQEVLSLMVDELKITPLVTSVAQISKGTT